MKSIRLFRWILVITNLLLIIIPVGSLVLSYFFLLPSVLTDEFNNEAKALTAAFAMWAAILVLTSVCFLGIAFTNSICLHLIAALLLCCPLALGVWIIVEQFVYKDHPNWPVVAITFTACLIWTVQVLTELLLSCALCCQPSETTSTADDDDAEAAKGLTSAEEGHEDDDDNSDSSSDKKKKKKEKEKEKKKKEKELKKKEKKDSKKEKGGKEEKEKLVNSSSKNSDVGSTPQSVLPSAPSSGGGGGSSGAFVPSAQAPPIEEVDEGEDEEEEDEEEEQDSQAGGQRPLSASNIRTSPGYTSSGGVSNVQYRSAFNTSSFTTQQNNLSGDNSSRINNINSDAVLLRPLSEDRQRLVQQMPGHYHGAITALGSGPGAVPPLATPEDTGECLHVDVH